MIEGKDQPLSEQQERLLSKYVDGECGLVGRALARRLMGRSPVARSFVERLGSVGETARRWYDMQAYTRVERAESLWQRVDQRIGQEQRASLYLGERRLLPEQKEKAWPVGWTLSGAALAAACLAFFLVPFWAKDGQAPVGGGFYSKSAVIGGQTPQVQPVVNRIAARRRPRYLGENPSSQVELDWLHSSGHVSLIPDRTRRSPIIWVNQRQKEEAQEPVLQGGNSGNIKILNERVPTALPVRGK